MKSPPSPEVSRLIMSMDRVRNMSMTGNNSSDARRKTIPTLNHPGTLFQSISHED